MFADHERLIFTYKVGGKGRHADPLAIRRDLLRKSGGRFYTWLDDSNEPDDHYRPELPPAEAMPPAQEGQPHPAVLLGEAHRTAKQMSALLAQERVVAVAREVFGMPPLDADSGEGYPESECWRVLAEYTGWLGKNESGGENSRSTSAADSLPETAGS